MKSKAFRYGPNGVEEENVTVSDEEVFTVFINNKEITLSASPRDLRELAVGFVVSEGFSLHEGITDVEVDDNRILVETGVCENIKASRVSHGQKFRREVILDSLRFFRECSVEWKLTGGTHSAALVSSEGELLRCFEDISRRNSLYKIIGWALLNNQSLSNRFVLFTGRVSGDVVEKLARVGVPLIVSNTAPLSKAIEFAEEYNVTLIGFARHPRFTVYSNPWRII
ncbi:MAG: formate dehydrogenase accessory sulfurtransferase FdhD [Candidatus Altiarchaeota archaeon]|nr:formate dehydrogenase accessory sulfurtransferase FdhD [Candidatus Altiarchaeota archaeon]